MTEMIAKVEKALVHGIRDESGQAPLMAVLLLLALGALMLPPLLGLMSTGLTAGQMHEEKTQRYYAADAGVEDGLWQIKNDQLSDLFAGYDPAYDPYAYSDYNPSYRWEYGLAKDINGKDVDVTIENVWIPKGLAAPDPGEARQIIKKGKLIITGNVITIEELPGYEIKISYYYERDEEEPYYDPGGVNLRVETIGIWLPPGFDYVAGSSNLEVDPGEIYYSVPEVARHASGKAVVWNFSSVRLKDFPTPGGSGYPLVRTIAFQFTSDRPDRIPGCALSWMTTTGVGDVPFAWDADSQVHKITSVATDPATNKRTTVQAYSAKTELRELGSAIAGEYRAMGSTLMVQGGGPDPDIRYQLLSESDAQVDDIPSSARVDAAYLYWSAWLAEAGEQILFEDDCHDFSNWIPGGDWLPSSGRFRGHHTGSAPGKYLTMHPSLDLSSYAGETVTVRWDQSIYDYWYVDSTDCLKFEFSGDGGSTWGGLITAFCGRDPPSSFSYDIPDEYLTNDFKMRFHLHNFGGKREYVYIDNIKISLLLGTIADTSVSFKINDTQVYFDENGEPAVDGEEITADEQTVIENFDSEGDPHGFSYACFKDVTELVQEYSDKGPGDNPTGNGKYTIGGVDGDTGDYWSYAAWSLIIVYCSPETEGHQLYLYDDFAYAHEYTNVDFDNDGAPGGSISGFLVPEPIGGEEYAAKVTCFVGEGDECYGDYQEGGEDIDCMILEGQKLSNNKSPENNVWNSKSPGLEEDGIDIDTFYVTWASGLLEPGDTSAQVDLPTGVDSWNLVYIILSFRSEVTAGGTISYLIGG